MLLMALVVYAVQVRWWSVSMPYALWYTQGHFDRPSPFYTTWRHRSRNRSIPHTPLTIGAPLVLTLSPRDFEILRLKCIWVTVLTFLGHVTSLC